ncbi:MAG: BatD family protein [Gammaproteobacteria bacterium]|nr:BatD family protein [Gammaproteobacteria bacterium]
MLRAGALLCSLLVASVVQAQDLQLVASVDRPTVRVNETFTYVLRANGPVSGRPDLSAIEQDFEVFNPRTATSLQIVNGQRSQISEWSYQMMPRREGVFTLPAIEIGGLLSNTVRLEVLPAPAASDIDQDIFIEVELDRDASYVQAQTIYTLRLYVGIGTGRATLTPPILDGGEAIIEKLGDDREYQTVRGNREYYVRERRYAIFPQSAGTLRIGPATFEAMVIPNRGFQRLQRLNSDVVELTVRPAVAPPDSHPGAVWLPATDVRLEREWGDRDTSFRLGVPRTRVLTIVADGLLETQLPDLALATTNGLRQYADRPELSRQVTDAGIQARRVERFAVIAQQPGELRIPAIELPWWNVNDERWEIARIEPEVIDVLPGDSVMPAAEPASPPVVAAPVEPEPNVWPWVSAALAAGWLATLVAWIVSGRIARRGAYPRRAAAPSKKPSSRALLKQVKAACRVNDAARTQQLLLDWAELHFAGDAPHSLGALADRLSGPLADELRVLEAALYGPGGGSEWRGARLAELVQRTQSVGREGKEKDEDPLIPLYR